MDNWKLLKDKITQETKYFFQSKSIDINEILDLFQCVLAYQVDDKYKLSGVAIKIPKAIYEILDENTTKKTQVLSFEILGKFEPFLRKLLLILDIEKFQVLTSEKKGLAAVIAALRLNPDRIDYNDEDANNLRECTDYNYHLYKVYNLRNTQSHEMEQWSNRQLAENIESILIFYVYIIEKHKENIKNFISLSQQHDYSGYLEALINDFEHRAKRFVHINSIEDYSIFEGYAVEHFSSGIDEAEEERSGTIDYLRRELLPERKMLIWADAGMGKSTTLQYLSYVDAQEYIAGINQKIPVFVPLGLLIDKAESIEEFIFKKLNLEYIQGKELLKSGGINLFLDAVNEIPIDENYTLQNQRKKEIQRLIDDYPNMLIIISNRPERYNLFKKIPVFRLQRMDKKKINEFLEKNIDDDIAKQVIFKEINDNERLLQVIGSPLMATRLIEIVIELKYLPKSEGEIIGKFIKSLYKREMIEKKDCAFEEIKIQYLLCGLAFYSLNKYGTNSGLSEDEVLNVFTDCMKNLYFLMDSIYAIKKIVELGILDYLEGMYVFSHQAYQDYFYSQERKRQNMVNRGNIEKLYININEEINNGIMVYGDNTKDYNSNLINSQYDKSTIYLIHSYPKEQRTTAINELCKTNLLLAAKAEASGEKNEEIDINITREAIKLIRSEESEKKAQGILALIELKKYNELTENASIINDDKKCREIINSIIFSLDNENCLSFIRLIINAGANIMLRCVVNAVYLKNYEYTWNNANYQVIENLSSSIHNDNKLKPLNIFKFYIGFNVPKELIKENPFIIANKLLPKGIELVKEIESKYNFGIDISNSIICKECILHNKYTFVKTAVNVLANDTKENKMAYLREAIEANQTYYIAYVYNFLTETQKQKYVNLFPQKPDFGAKIRNCKRLAKIIDDVLAEQLLFNDANNV